MTTTEIRNLPPIDATQRYSMKEAAAYLRQSLAKTYLDGKNGKLELVRDGRRTYVTGQSLLDRSRPFYADLHQ